MQIVLKKGDITRSSCEAIVNAANSGLWAGGGVCGAIFAKAGYEELQEACNKIGHCPVGGAVITPGFKLNAKYVIHAVGSIPDQDNAAKLLASAYTNALKRAEENNIRSIAFPSISTGIFGYPLNEATEIALNSINTYFKDNPNSKIKLVEFDLFDDYTYSVFESKLKKILG